MNKVFPIDEEEQKAADDEHQCAMRKAVYYQAADENDLKVRLSRVQGRMKKADKKIRAAAAQRHLSLS